MTKAFVVVLRGDAETRAIMKRVPINLREKVLKQAMREASTVFQKQSQMNVRGLKAKGRPRWGKVSGVNLERQIKRRLMTRGYAVVGRTLTTGISRLYAASVEYGHRKFIFGEYRGGEPVPFYPFWRPAQDATRLTIDALVLNTLRRKIKEITRG